VIDEEVVSDEPIAPLPVLVPYARFHEVQQRRHPVVVADPSLTEQPAAVGTDSADPANTAESVEPAVRSIPVET
jgi:hypothetical protein